jgi:hypothetical protein
MLNERDLEIADSWIRANVLDKGDHDFDDVEEDGDTLKYLFTRHPDRAWVVYMVAVKRGKLYSIKKEVYHEESQGDKPDEEEWIVRPEGGKRQRRATKRG